MGQKCEFFLPRVFNAPAEGVSWNFVTVLGLKNYTLFHKYLLF